MTTEVTRLTPIPTTPPPPCPTNLIEAIQFCAYYGIRTTPVRPGAKRGYRRGWSQLDTPTYTLGDYKADDNIGGLNGSDLGDGYHLCDIDTDTSHPIAQRVIERLLPPTGWRFGRTSHPRSHGLYRVKGKLFTRKYPGIGAHSGLELRGFSKKTTHTLSVMPGSIWVDSKDASKREPVRFIEPLTLIGTADDPDEFARDVQLAALGGLIAQVWPTSSHHDLRLGFAKVLLELTVTVEEATTILTTVMAETGSDAQDAVDAIRSTDEALRTGRETKGATAILEVFGDSVGQDVLKKIGGILRTQAFDDGRSILVNQLTTSMADRAWESLMRANEPAGIFSRLDKVVILQNSANTCINALYAALPPPSDGLPNQLVGFREINVDTFREVMSRMVPCVTVTHGKRMERAFSTKEFATLMLARPIRPLPEARGFTSIPFFTPAGELVTEPGFHPDTGMFYQPGGFDPTDIPAQPKQADIEAAIATLDEMVWQFPFRGREGIHPYTANRDGRDWQRTASYANMLAFPLTVLTRSLFNAVPLFLFDKPTTRTGASLLVQCWCRILTGSWPNEAEWGASQEERRKFLTAILKTGTPIIFLDEVKDLFSQDLNKILTGKAGRVGRVLGTSEVTTPQSYATFASTGNNPRYPMDMAGRICRTRLDADIAMPSSRTGWDKNLEQWVPKNREQLLTALYVLIRG